MRNVETVVFLVARLGALVTGVVAFSRGIDAVADASRSQPELYKGGGLCLIAAALAFGFLTLGKRPRDTTE
jgi:hypothetical protein